MVVEMFVEIFSLYSIFKLLNIIFKDGFTTREEGFGIGLSVCRKYLAEQLGTIELTSSDEEKTEFLIKLPLIDIV